MATDIKQWRSEIAKYIPSVDPPDSDEAVRSTCIDFCEFTKIWNVRLPPIDIVVIEAVTDIAFVNGSPCTITSTVTDFTDYFSDTDVIVTDHQTSETDESDNTGPFLVDTVAENLLTFNSLEDLVSETAGDSTYLSKAVYPLTTALGTIVEARKVKFDGKDVDLKGEHWLEDNVPNWQTNMASAPKYATVDQDRKLRLVPVPSESIANGLKVWVALKPLRNATSVETFLYNDWLETITDGALGILLTMTSKPWRDFDAGKFYRKRYENARYAGLRRARLGHSKARNNGISA
jgi:hypothetical protein